MLVRPKDNQKNGRIISLRFEIILVNKSKIKKTFTLVVTIVTLAIKYCMLLLGNKYESCFK